MGIRGVGISGWEGVRGVGDLCLLVYFRRPPFIPFRERSHGSASASLAEH